MCKFQEVVDLFHLFMDKVIKFMTNISTCLCPEYRTVSGVAGPLVILDKVKVGFYLL